MEAYVGADWSATKVVCATATAEMKPQRITGAVACLGEVRGLVERVRERHPEATEVHVCIEGGALGWVRMFQAAGAIVHVVDPGQAKRFAQSLRSSGAKSDGADAQTLTEMLRSPAHRPAARGSTTGPVELLHRLGAAHEQCTKNRTRALQQLRGLVREHMPQVEQALPRTLDSVWVRHLLRAAPTPWHLRGIEEEGLKELTPRCQNKTRKRLWAAIQSMESPWLTEAFAEVEAMRVRQLLDQLELFNTQLKAIDEEVDQLTSGMASREVLESVDGIGLRQAATMLEFAFGEELTDRDQAGIRLGACPVFVGSGETRTGQPKGRARMRRAAHTRGRRATYLLGRLAQQNLEWAAAMYAHGRAKGQSAATAYRRIARSLLRILTAMVRTGEAYDDARYVGALKSNGVEWAQTL